MIIYENADMYDKSNIEIERNLVKSYDKKKHWDVLRRCRSFAFKERYYKIYPLKSELPPGKSLSVSNWRKRDVSL